VNLDDQGDCPSGTKSSAEHHVARLIASRVDQDRIRELARRARVWRVWKKPASAWPFSRIRVWTAGYARIFETVEQGEDALRALGFRQFRVRHHGENRQNRNATEELQRALNYGDGSQELSRTF